MREFTRRKFVQISCAASSLPLIAACGEGSSPASSTAAAMTTRLREEGFRETNPQPRRTDYEFNGGLRYDEYPMNVAGPRTFVVQECERVEDAESTELLVLPRFSLLAWQTSEPLSAEISLRLLLELLIETLGLEPAYMAAVTATDYTEVLGELERWGIGPEQIFVRDAGVAREAGDGSGYFGPPGYPGPGFPTVSLHYSRSMHTAGRIRSYPLPGDLVELGESGVYGGGCGLERVAWASGGS